MNRVGLCLILLAASAFARADATRLTMQDAVREALLANPAMQAARYETSAANIEAGREKPVAKPTLTLEAQALVQGPTVTFPRGVEDATVLPRRYTRLGLTLDQPVYRAGVGAAWRRYNASVHAASETSRKAASDLIRDVNKAYLDLLTARDMEQVAREGLDLAEAHLSLVRRMVEAGLSAVRDVPAAEAEVAAAREGLIQATDGADLALGNLDRLLGRPLTQPIEVVRPEVEPTVPSSPEAGSALALAHRPELLMLRNQIEAAKAGTRLAAVQSMPGVSVRASMAQQTPSAFVNSRWYAVGLTFSWAVLDGGKTSADTATAKTRLAQLEALLRDAEAGIALDVHNAFAAVRSARARTESAASQTKAAETALDISVLRYEQRSAALLEVSSARLAVTQARTALARARNDLLAAILECRHACAMDIEGIETP